MGKIKPGVTIRGSGRAGRGDDPHGVTAHAGYPEAHHVGLENPDPEEQASIHAAGMPLAGPQGWVD